MACRLETRQGCLHRITRCGRTRRDSALTPEKRQSRRGSQAFRELLLGGRETGARVLLLRPRSRRFSTCALLLRPPVAAGFPTCVLLAHTSWFSTRSVRAGKKPAPTCVPRCAGVTRRPRSRSGPRIAGEIFGPCIRVGATTAKLPALRRIGPATCGPRTERGWTDEWWPVCGAGRPNGL